MLHTISLALLLVAPGATAPPPTSPSPAESEHVVADIANLRASPTAAAAVVARLHINTPLVVLERKAGWLRVHPFDASGGRADVNGWIAAELVGARVSAEELSRSYNEAQRAGNTNDAVKWARRLVALDGAQREYLEQLRDALLMHGDKKASAAMARRLEGQEPVYFAVCSHKSYAERPMRRAVLLAVDDGTRLKPLSGDTISPDALAKLARTLDGYAWFSSAGQLQGSPFLTPFGGAIWNDDTGIIPPKPGAPLTQLGDDTPGKLVLGPCEETHAGLLATSPLVGAGPVKGPATARALTLIEELVRSWNPEGDNALPGTTTFTQGTTLQVFRGAFSFVSATLHATWANHHGDEAGTRSTFTLLDNDGRAAAPITLWGGSNASWIIMTYGGRELGALPITGHDEGDANGMMFLVPRAKRLELLTVTTDTYGC